MNGWENAGRSGPTEILMIHTNNRRNFNKGSKDQTGASILSHEKASDTTDKQSHQFSYKDLTLQITCLVNTALWLRASR